ncbi:LysR substrate-binding domain-containing protein [Liquorilactobacillus nagelii]|uniref:LysR substrate-binding domain-containing protein n=1 Tax=Liquorilactobacillus nagelii TaxID=82688 RepID=UPI001CC93E87|nr:LysR substrate-binding domain-containing protein [Liquorilactobacillus nagelii]ULQ49192.1 LysR substrate-binding domain-containing protein [Liquorilactobacillus nagelii]
MITAEYQTFLILSETLSYTKTAAKLFISQPAVTQQIQRLENQLEIKLVDYQRPYLKLTPAGEKLAVFLTRMRSQTTQLMEILQDDHQKHEIQFGITRSLGEVFGSQLIELLQLKNDLQKISCLAENTQHILQQIELGKMDFGIIEGNFNKAKFSYHILSQEEFIPICSPTHPLARKKIVSWNELAAYPLLIREPGSGSRTLLTALAQKENISLNDFKQLITISEPTLIRQLVCAGSGISFLYRLLIKKELAAGTIKQLPLERGTIAHDLYFIYAKENYFAQQYFKWFTELKQQLQ